jgi:hypothetical protein
MVDVPRSEHGRGQGPAKERASWLRVVHETRRVGFAHSLKAMRVYTIATPIIGVGQIRHHLHLSLLIV